MSVSEPWTLATDYLLEQIRQLSELHMNMLVIESRGDPCGLAALLQDILAIERHLKDAALPP